MSKFDTRAGAYARSSTSSSTGCFASTCAYTGTSTGRFARTGTGRFARTGFQSGSGIIFQSATGHTGCCDIGKREHTTRYFTGNRLVDSRLQRRELQCG